MDRSPLIRFDLCRAHLDGSLDPAPKESDLIGTVFSQLAPTVAPWIAILILIVWIEAECRKFTNRRRFDRQSGIESIMALSWQEFEELIAEGYRRQPHPLQKQPTPTKTWRVGRFDSAGKAEGDRFKSISALNQPALIDSNESDAVAGSPGWNPG